MQPVPIRKIMADIRGPLAGVDRCGDRAAESCSSSRVREIRARNPLDQFAHHRVGCRSALGVAEDQTIDVKILPLAKTFVRYEEERLVPDKGTAQTSAELVTLERRRIA